MPRKKALKGDGRVMSIKRPMSVSSAPVFGNSPGVAPLPEKDIATEMELRLLKSENASLREMYCELRMEWLQLQHQLKGND